MNKSQATSSIQLQTRRNWRYLLKQYFYFLGSCGSKIVTLVKSTTYHFGVHIIISIGNYRLTKGCYNAYFFLKEFKQYIGPMTVRGGQEYDFS